MHTINEIAPTLEKERLEVLRKYEVLDTPPDPSFDILTKLAARLLKVPIAMVSLVDKDRIWFKSRYGIEIQETDRQSGLCSSVITSDGLHLIEDALKDEKVKAHSFVSGDFGLRFYAGVPLKTKDGFNIGAFCVMDQYPRVLMEVDKEILESLADLVMYQLDLRLDARTAIRHQHQILNTTAHDLKNPLSIMPLLADMIIHNKDNPKAIEDIASQIKDAGKRMAGVIEDLLETSLEESGRVQLRLKALDLAEVVTGVINSNTALAKNKSQNLSFKIAEECTVYADPVRLTEIVDNLINNAIKYSPHGKDIFVEVKTQDERAILEVRDEGPGLTRDDMKNLYRRFTCLSAQPTGGENSTGLGLSIVKNLVDAHKGKISAVSDGPGKGAKFVVELPLSENLS